MLMTIKRCLILCFFCSSIAIANANDATELGKILQTTTSIKANFIQLVFNNKGQVTRQMRGKMAVKKPLLFRWEITQPMENLLVIDGKKFWNYDIDLQQVTRQDMHEAYTSSPVSLFLAADIKHINKQYTIKKLAPQHFSLSPKLTADGFKKVELIFVNNVIDTLILVDQLEQTSKINFSQVKYNTSLSPDLFTFVPPLDVDVVGE